MKKTVFLLLTSLIVIGVPQVKSQTSIGNNTIHDTVPVSWSNHQITAHKQIYIGHVKAYDPEGSELEYRISHQKYPELFQIDQDGIITADYLLLRKLYYVGKFKIQVTISDDKNQSSDWMVIKVGCI